MEGVEVEGEMEVKLRRVVFVLLGSLDLIL